MAEAKYCQSSQDAAEEPPANTPSSGQPLLPSSQDGEQGVQLSTQEPTFTRLSGLEVEAPSPSNDSLYGRAKAVKAESPENVDFTKKIIKLVVDIIQFWVLRGIYLGFPVFVIVFGAKYKDDCPAEPYIPIYLIVAGSSGVLRNSVSVMRDCCQKEDEKKRKKNTRKIDPIEFFFDCFLFAWLFTGSVWIYPIVGEFSITPGDSNFCDLTLYWSAFWLTVAAYFSLGCKCFCNLLAMYLGVNCE